ncbi:CRTAC1 family protein [bacterium]|nr:CRTAC1 family protein [bacterium]
MKAIRLLPTLLLACACLLCSASSDLAMRINSLWRSGQSSEAINLIDEELAAGNTELSFISSAAEAMLAEHRYQKAADLYAQLAGKYIDDDGRFLDAKLHEWRASYLANGENSRADWIAEERRRIGNSRDGAANGIFGEAKAGSVKNRSQLLLELAYCLDEESGNRPGRPTELLERYPDSNVVLRLAAADAAELGSINNDEERIKAVSQFLAGWPRSYWRHVAFRYWLYSAWRMHDREEFSKASAAYLAEYGGSAEAHGAVSRYMLDLDMPVDEGLVHAKRSMELFELELGITGDLTSLSTINNATKYLPRQLPYLPPAERQTFILYLYSRHNMARYMNRTGKYDKALDLVTPVIGVEPFTLNEEESLAPFLLEAGNAHIGLGNSESAYRFLLRAAFVGDSADRYSGQADEKLKKLEGKLDPETVKYETSRLLPNGSEVSTIPVFSDLSISTEIYKQRAARVCWVDVDGDGSADLLLDGNVLLMNELGRFRDRTDESGLQGDAAGAVAGDLDNDGDNDLYCFGNGREADRVYINNSGRFSMVSGFSGDSRATEAAALVDLDNDGLLDIYAVNFESPTGIRMEEDSVLRNEGASGFNVRNAEQQGMLPPLGESQAGRGVSVGDMDNDGNPDLYVSNYRLGENMLFSSMGNGSYRQLARRWGIAGFWKDGNWGNSIGSAMGDVDNDGDLDLFVANLSNPRFEHVSDGSILLINHLREGGTFEDRTQDAHIAYNSTNACPVIFDANNDGWQDIFITSIYPGRSSHLYVNDGKGHFVDLSYISNTRVQDAYGAAVADYDNDGDLDLAIASPSGCHLLRNDSPTRNWISFTLSGGKGTGAIAPAGMQFSNRSAIGARLTIKAGGMELIREIQSGNGSGCGNELRACFGLGDIRGPFDVEITYPGGIRQSIFIRRPNKHFVISETNQDEMGDEREPEPVEEEAPSPVETGVNRDGMIPD